MKTAARLRLGALGCAFALPVCMLVVKPWVAMGTIDDTSYARSAQLLAATGHIVYNGWAAPILGWHLYWGALFIKLFGFSFNVLRISTLPVAMAAAFVSQRSMVRCGLTEWNATLATLTLVLSPLFLPLTFSYMTDIGGYFVLVLCFYACLRALQAESDAKACAWLACAAFSNAVGGTVRQTGWLGLLVILPSTLWLLRGRRKVLLWGIFFLVLGLAMMAGAMEWYRHQPRIMPEPIWRGPLTRDKLRTILHTIVRTLFDGLIFVLPVLLSFFPKLQWKNRRAWLATLVGAVAIYGFLLLIQPQPGAWLEPTIGNYFSERGVLTGSVIHGLGPTILGHSIRLILTALVIGGVSAMAFELRWSSPLQNERAEEALSWHSLSLLAGPVAAVYILLMMSRAGVNMVFDRYLLPLLFLFLLLMARAYQERISGRLPLRAVVVLVAVVIFSVGATHDAFSMLRGRLQAAQALEARGVPDNEIDGGWEFNSWTTLQRLGYLLPYEGGDSLTEQRAASFVPPCIPLMHTTFPGLHAKYTLATVPDGCGGQVGIPPVRYREWFGPHEVSIYIVASDIRTQPKRNGS